MPKSPSLIVLTISAMFFFALSAPPLGFLIAAPADTPRIAFPLAWMFAPVAGIAGLLFGGICFGYATFSKENYVGTPLSAFIGALSGAIAINAFGYWSWGYPTYMSNSEYKSFLLCSIVGGFVSGAIFSRFSFIKPSEEA